MRIVFSFTQNSALRTQNFIWEGNSHENDTIKPVVVLGGGIAGITAALELSRAGLPAVLVEKSPFFGGLAASFGCKATDVCQKCGACRVEQGLRDLLAAPGPHLVCPHGAGGKPL